MRFVLPVSLLLGSLLSAADTKTPVLVVEEIVAKVNGDIVTKTELDREARKYRDAANQPGATAEYRASIDERIKNALRDRIDQLLLVQRAKDLNISVDADVNRYISDIQKKVSIADPEQFADMVRKETGQTFEDWKNEMRNQYLTQRVVGMEIRSKINVPREQIRKIYDERKAEFVRKDTIYLREILVATTRPDAEKRAKDLAERARKGERFTDLARENSDAPTAKDEGELPPFEKGQLDQTLEDLLWDKDKGYVTDPLRRQNGWVILRVDEHTRAGQATFEEMEERISNMLAQPQMEAKVREYLTSLRQDAFLEIKAGYVDSGAAPGKDTTWTDPAELKPETISKSELSNYRRRKLLWLVPIPGTKVAEKSGESQSKVIKAK